MKEIRHWWIQKPIKHNCPIENRAAVFEEFKPSVAEQDCEWIKVLSANDVQKTIGMGLTRYVYVMTSRDKLAEALEKCSCRYVDFSAWDRGIRDKQTCKFTECERCMALKEYRGKS